MFAACTDVIGSLLPRRFLFAEEFVYARGWTARTVKVTLPSPSLFANFYDLQRSRDAYPSLESFLADVAEILREEVDELVRLDCEYIQLDLRTIRCCSIPRIAIFTPAENGQPSTGSISALNSTTSLGGQDPGGGIADVLDVPLGVLIDPGEAERRRVCPDDREVGPSGRRCAVTT